MLEPATAPLVLAIASRDCLAKHTDKQRELTKPGYEGVSVYLGLMQTLIHCSDEDLWLTSSELGWSDFLEKKMDTFHVVQIYKWTTIPIPIPS